MKMRANTYKVVELHLNIEEVNLLRTLCYYTQVHRYAGNIRYEADRLLEITYYYHSCKKHTADYILLFTNKNYRIFLELIHDSTLHENRPLFAEDFEKYVLGALKEVS